jgi:hypothetical protein
MTLKNSMAQVNSKIQLDQPRLPVFSADLWSLVVSNRLRRLLSAGSRLIWISAAGETEGKDIRDGGESWRKT